MQFVMMMKRTCYNFLSTTVLFCTIGILSVNGQRKLGDNLGNHVATKNLNMSAKDVANIQQITAENVVVGTSGSIANSHIALQVNGAGKTILIPRVADLLNVSNPPIPTASALEGMLVYDMATHKLYIRNNSSWTAYRAETALASGSILVADQAGIIQPSNINGDVAISNTGLTAIGTARVQTNMIANRSVAVDKFSYGTANQYLQTNAAGTGVSWVTVTESPTKYVDLSSRQDNINGFKTFTSDSGVVARGTIGVGIVPVTSEGARLMFYNNKVAFRAGYLTATSFADANLGLYSAAFGNASIASGMYSFATGTSSASADASVALGASAASATYSSSGGTSNASGASSIAMGVASSATEIFTSAFGSNNISGYPYSVALGTNVNASGFSTVNIGRNSVNAGYSYTVILSDGNAGTITNNISSQFAARFSGGYRLFSDSTMNYNIRLLSGGTSWSTVSDKRKKENWRAINLEAMLNKVDTMFLGSWNYIGQSPLSFRHYGPMAQDFFQAFGKDSLGKIGNDTSIAAADMDGVILTSIQGLIKRSKEIEKLGEKSKKTTAITTKKLSANIISVDRLLKTAINELNNGTRLMKSQRNNVMVQLPGSPKF
jgi:hypothetical protein